MRPVHMLAALALALGAATAPWPAGAGETGTAKASRTIAPGLTLPATFEGTLPTASGPGMEWHVDLWPDQTFHLRQDYEAGPSADIGRWHADPARGAIVLRGARAAPVYLQILDEGDLRLMDVHGEPIESDLNYRLTRGALDPAQVALPMGGTFRYMAEAATFTECLTGRTYPVAMEGAYVDAERAYLAADIDAGAPAHIAVNGRLALRPAMEGPDRTHLVIDRLARLDSAGTCDTNRAARGLIDTYWRLLRAGETDIAPHEDAREPHLVLHRGETPGFGATVGCNAMRGGYGLDGGALSFGETAMTRMACPDPLAARERALSEALGRVAGWRITANVLELLDASGAVVVLAEGAYLP